MDSLKRKEPSSIEKAIHEYIRDLKIAGGVNIQCIFKAWDEVSGAAAYTRDKFYKDGVLYISLTSSVVRNNLYFQQAALIRELNAWLAKDTLFEKDDARCPGVTRLVLK